MSHEAVIPSDSVRVIEGFPRGLCAGVKRALAGYDMMISDAGGEPVYSVGEPAHNTHIIDGYKKQGVIFVGNVNEVPNGARAVFGPHGCTKDDLEKARQKGLTFMDTECPLVTRVKDGVKKNAENGETVLYFGQKGHSETRAAMSVAPNQTILVLGIKDALSVSVSDPEKVALHSQTTHNADEVREMAEKLREKYPNLKIPRTEDICFATRDRQAAVKELIGFGAETIVVVGSPTSSNSKKLKAVALENGAKKVFFVDGAGELDDDVFEFSKIGLTAGASVEDEIVSEVREFLSRGQTIVENVIVADESKINFSLPKIQKPS